MFYTLTMSPPPLARTQIYYKIPILRIKLFSKKKINGCMANYSGNVVTGSFGLCKSTGSVLSFGRIFLGAQTGCSDRVYTYCSRCLVRALHHGELRRYRTGQRDRFFT